MSNTAKTAGALGVIGTVTALVTLWPRLTPVLIDVGAILLQPQVQAVIVCLLIAALINGSLPHYLPSSWPAARTRGVAGAVGFVIGFSAAVWLVPTKWGVVYALLVGFGAPTLAQAGAGVLYWLRPRTKPESLQ